MPKIKNIVLVLCLCCIPCPTMAVEYSNAVKVTFLSWITGSTKVSYERALPNHQSAEFCGSMIGAGYDKFGNNPRGFTMRYAHKFFLADNEFGGLCGFYLRHEVIYSHYTYNSVQLETRTLAQMTALLATTGYQISYGRWLIDVWVGGGYAFGTPAETGYHHGFALWNALGMKNNNIALSFSVRLGICF